VFSLVTFLLVVIVHIVLLLCPPITTLVMHPGLLLSPRSYVDLLNYYLAFGISFVGTFIGQVIYCLLPFQESQVLYEFMAKFFQTEIKKRDIAFTIVEQETYTF